MNTSWTTVLSGVVVSSPVVTSYGFCTITDARTISAYSNNGKLLWENNYGKSTNVKLFELPYDFILFLDKNSNTIKLINPSGKELWNRKQSFPVINILPGRDGRFFIIGEKNVQCLSITGLEKWTEEIPLMKKTPVQELPDGSLIVFLQEEDGKTKGLRYTPYGECIEQIVFAGEIISADSFDEGILLIFKDGSAGLFSVENGLSRNKWVLAKKSSGSLFTVSKDKKDCLYLELQNNSVIMNQIDYKTGEILKTSTLSEINGSNINKVFYQNNFLLLIDNKNAVLYDLSAKNLWFSILPVLKGKNSWNYLFYTNDNHLVFCYKNWTLDAYKTIQVQKNNSDLPPKTYSCFLTQNDDFDTKYSSSFSKELVSEERISELKTGGYNQNELAYENQIISICNAYLKTLITTNFGIRKEETIFEKDSAAFEMILNQLCFFSNNETQNLEAAILSRTENNSFQKTLLSGIIYCGYDPQGNILNSLEKLSESTSYKNTKLISLICDSVYSVCYFMGRPAYNSKGKDILKNFLYPSYDKNTREKARNTLKKIIELDL